MDIVRKIHYCMYCMHSGFTIIKDFIGMTLHLWVLDGVNCLKAEIPPFDRYGELDNTLAVALAATLIDISHFGSLVS